MQCPVCNNEVGSQSAFCGHCGAPVAAAAPEAAPPPTAYTPPAAYTAPPVSYSAPPASYSVPPAGYSAPPVSSVAATYPAPVASSSSGLTPNTAAALSYVTIIPAILFLVIEPYNKIPLVRFHCFQSIGLAIVWFALWVVIMILSMFIAFIPGLRLILFLFPLVEIALGVGFFILWLVTILKASKGEWFKLPFIGDFAMKQAQS